MTRHSTIAQLRAELEQVRAQLADAEDILHAIRNGEVDAVVVRGKAGEQVYSLSETGRVYRQLIESMSEGAVTLSTDGIILYCNSHLAQMLGRPMEQVLGTMLRTHVLPQEETVLDTTLAHAENEPVHVDLTLQAADGRELPARLSATRFLGESSESIFCVVAIDLSEQKRRIAEIADAERMARSILEQAAEAIVVCDAKGEVIRFNVASGQLCQGSPLHRFFVDAFPLRTTAGEAFDPAPMFRGETLHNVDVEIALPDHMASLILNSGPLHSNKDVIGCVISLTDITERKRAEFESARLAAIVECSDDAIIGKDLDNRITSWNRGAELLFGYAADQMIGSSVLALIPADREHEEECVFAQLCSGETVAHYDTLWRHADGHLVDVSVTASPIKYNNGKVIGASNVVRNISQRVLAERRIKSLNRVYAMLSGINMLIVHTHSRDQLFLEACDIAAQAGGFYAAVVCSLDRQTGQLVPDAAAGEDSHFTETIKHMLAEDENGLTRWIAQALTAGHLLTSDCLLEAPLALLQGKTKGPAIQSIAALPLVVNQCAVAVIVLFATESQFFHAEELDLLKEMTGDIAFAIDHIDKEAQLDYLAFYDALTGLANRNLFLERVSQFLRGGVDAANQLGICVIDLERFKNVNNSLSWSSGDALLRQFANWLTNEVVDVNLLARLGGDQFVVALPHVGRGEGAARFAARIAATLPQHPFAVDDTQVRLSVAVGVALCPNDGIDAGVLIRNAEAALKKAKTEGKRYLFYTQKMTQEISAKLVLENQLRQAFEKSEFVLHYQPKVDFASGKVTGAEALLRWNKPNSGLMPPVLFIAMLEETGLIHEVGRWAMQQTVADSRRWREAGLTTVRIAVNFSALQLGHPLFLDNFRHDLGADPEAHSDIELEITESAIMERTKNNIAILDTVRAMGIPVAIDDFGTGFSSLSYLVKLPVNTLKIDRSFLVDMTASPENLALVSTIIGLAHALHIRVVAEGVESNEQAKLLRLLSCDEMQGYLFSEPVPRDIFEAKFLLPRASSSADASEK